MDISPVIFASLVGLLGVATGAWLQAYLTKKNNQKSKLSELQNSAYADFLNAASSIAVAQRVGDRDRVTSELAALADAKARICIYGHSTVIHELAKFIRAGGTLQKESEILSFTRLCLRIRESAGMTNQSIPLTYISQLLFHVEVSETPTPRRK